MRFLNVVLTIIAVELGWIAISQIGVPVSAQQAATRVVITGIEVPRNQSLPTTLRGVREHYSLTTPPTARGCHQTGRG